MILAGGVIISEYWKVTTMTNYEDLLETLAETQIAANKIEQTIDTLPVEFRENLQAKMSHLSSMQTIVLSFASSEVARLESLQRITLSQLQPHGHA